MKLRVALAWGVAVIAAGALAGPAAPAGTMAGSDPCEPSLVRAAESHTLRFVVPLCPDYGVFHGFTVAPRVAIEGSHPRFIVEHPARDDTSQAAG